MQYYYIRFCRSCSRLLDNWTDELSLNCRGDCLDCVRRFEPHMYYYWSWVNEQERAQDEDQRS